MPSPLSLQPAHADIEIPMPMWHRGPGWYDSSWDLICGLDIAELPDVAVWIGACVNVSAANAPA